MQLQTIFSLLPLISSAYAGVFIQGFSDGNTATAGCQTGLGSVTIPQNGECVGFPAEWQGIQVAGGGSNECFLRIFQDDACQVDSETQIGPINDPNLGGCIGPFPFDEGGNTVFTGIGSGSLVNCPT
ncbi:uncharacterized protein LY89DRAFT_686508 [Mollisia scopiformis]|uniref:Uncharacterized protein n=1 Tax=Mollisia scopiformis TaxID=149040 RepID=A0A194X404_MOLSC|nr:uncharacterized protein LY89DRAFT_686508 [Mollisia scopiformis]KUJ14901.1 hypothetical protein LY89DRAFT_686508 [Mollisia scopiformis]